MLQAEDLDRNWMGMNWLSSQIQAINPIMIVTLVPLFSYVVYPAIDKVFPLSPLRKISLGLFIMVPGFAIVAFVQSWIDAGETPFNRLAAIRVRNFDSIRGDGLHHMSRVCLHPSPKEHEEHGHGTLSVFGFTRQLLYGWRQQIHPG